MRLEQRSQNDSSLVDARLLREVSVECSKPGLIAIVAELAASNGDDGGPLVENPKFAREFSQFAREFSQFAREAGRSVEGPKYPRELTPRLPNGSVVPSVEELEQRILRT